MQLYTQQPVQVEAVQFRGWQTLNFEAMMKWLNSYNPFYVPQGYEHYLRTEGEKDRSRGDTLDHAYGYLVIDLSGKRTRINDQSWIVKNAKGDISIYTDQDFKKHFVEYIKTEEA